MPSRRPLDPILARFRVALEVTYGARLERALLFGSRARGDGEADSDYDVAVFLRDLSDRPAELNRLADLATEILYDTGEWVHATPFAASAYDDPQMPLMHEVRREGLDL